MNTKALIGKGLIGVFTVVSLCIACSDENGKEEEGTPDLAVDLRDLSLKFSANAVESYEVAVTTNQGNWKVISNQTWCKVSKEGDKFTVSASRNTASQPLTAMITVSAGSAQDVTITATQNAAVEDKGTTIWEDTHWRWLKLQGKVKTMKLHHGEEYDFNTSGKLTRFDNYSTTFEYSYDSKGRLIKYKETDNGGEIRSLRKKKRRPAARNEMENESSVYIEEYTYGDNNKYWPVNINIGNAESTMFEDRREMEVPMLIKGIVSLKQGYEGFLETAVLNMSANRISVRIEDEEATSEVLVKYSGDYPTECIAHYTETYEEGEIMESVYTHTFTYGNNHKYAKVTEKHEDPEITEPSYEYINKYVTDNTIYHLLEEGSDVEDGYLLQYEYDDKGRIVKETLNGEQYTYTYKDDKHGNWIERTATYRTNTETIKREITYYP